MATVQSAETHQTSTSSSPLEQVLQLFSAVLEIDNIGPDDNLFTLGGSSLTAARLIQRVNRAFRTNLSLGAVFQASTPATFTKKLEEHLNSMAMRSPPL